MKDLLKMDVLCFGIERMEAPPLVCLELISDKNLKLSDKYMGDLNLLME